MARYISPNSWTELAPQAKFDAATLAVFCGISIRQLERDFQKHLGSPPQAWLNHLRLETAKPILLTGAQVKAVAFQLGYNRPSHFCREFKTRFGMTPQQFVSLSLYGTARHQQARSVAQ